MNILNDVVSGAARQFGREFGRAGANSILKGANYYAVKGASDYSGRIKPSDSDVVKSIKEINKVKFVSTNKGNISRLIELTDLVISNIEFNGNQTLSEINDITELINQYNDKFNHGSALVDDDYKEKSVDYLEERRNEFVRLMDKFNNDIKNHIEQNLEIAKNKRKSKNTAVLLAVPLLGLQWAYLKSPGYTVLSILLCWTIIVPVINLIMLLKLLLMKADKFDQEFNPEYVYFSQFNIKN
jgi:TM2 domain-containing membrane protein YozV